MKVVLKRNLVVCCLAASVGIANAVTFSNVIIKSPPLSNGSSYNTIGSSISFFTPNAIVGDPVAPLRAGTLNIQYDATSGPMMTADKVTVNLGNALSGSGMVFFNEMVFEIDANTGNEIGGPIGTDSHVFNSSNSNFYSNTIMLSRQVGAIRVKKSFTLLAPDTSAFDLAAVAIINQDIQTTPEPGTLIAVGAGLVSLVALRRRKK